MLRVYKHSDHSNQHAWQYVRSDNCEVLPLSGFVHYITYKTLPSGVVIAAVGQRQGIILTGWGHCIKKNWTRGPIDEKKRGQRWVNKVTPRNPMPAKIFMGPISPYTEHVGFIHTDIWK